MTWKRDLRPENVRTFGDFTVFSEVDSERQTAHVVRFPDGRELRVLPDERSGAKRSNLVRQAVERLNADLEANTAISYETYLYGLLLESGFTRWEWEVGKVSIEEWLDDWLEAGWVSAAVLLDDLKAAGWEIRRRDDR